MALIVQKYGGTSVGSLGRIKRVAQKIKKASQKDQLVVVVSAMGHSTDVLIAQAQKLSSHPEARELDMLLTAAERISMALLSIALHEQGVPAISLTGSQSGIVTTSSHKRARIERILPGRILEALAKQKVVIVAGFQGVSAQKEVTTLGRGGSDTTAVSLAAVLGASRCEIYSDVDGVYSANPRLVTGAKRQQQVEFEPMAVFALLGAQVLHARCVLLAQANQVELWVKKTFGTSSGTRVNHMENKQKPEGGKVVLENRHITGIASDGSKVLVEVTFFRSTGLFAMLGLAAKRDLSVTAMHWGGGSEALRPVEPLNATVAQNCVHFFIEGDQLPDWQSLLQGLERDDFVKSVTFDQEVIPVSIVGLRLSEDLGLLDVAVQKLEALRIPILGFDVQPYAVIFKLSKKFEQKAVVGLHSVFFPDLKDELKDVAL